MVSTRKWQHASAAITAITSSRITRRRGTTVPAAHLAIMEFVLCNVTQSVPFYRINYLALHSILSFIRGTVQTAARLYYTRLLLARLFQPVFCFCVGDDASTDYLRRSGPFINIEPRFLAYTCAPLLSLLRLHVCPVFFFLFPC